MENHELLLEEHEFNLSDFALFLSVMKNPRAYQCALSIILAEPDIELVEVKVEQVVLNKVGKRAIRLDAWARSKDQRQFNMEMQNDTKNQFRKLCFRALQTHPAVLSASSANPQTVFLFFFMRSTHARSPIMPTVRYTGA